MSYSNRQALISALAEFDRKLGDLKLNKKVDVYVFGGTAAIVGYGADRGTDDIDLWLEDGGLEKQLLELGKDCERKYGVTVESANLTLMVIEDPDWRERAVEILPGTFRHVRVLAVGKEDLILSKLASFRDQDRGDIEYLATSCHVDVDKLIEYYKSARQYYIGDVTRVDNTFRIVLKDYFGRDLSAKQDFGPSHEQGGLDL